jgi:hypothetical protein
VDCPDVRGGEARGFLGLFDRERGTATRHHLFSTVRRRFAAPSRRSKFESVGSIAVAPPPIEQPALLSRIEILRADVALCWNCDSDLGPVRAPSVARDLRN